MKIELPAAPTFWAVMLLGALVMGFLDYLSCSLPGASDPDSPLPREATGISRSYDLD